METARRIRARLGSGMPILLLSAYDWENVKEEAIQAGINGFLTKPIFKADILEQMKQYIQGGYQEYEEQQIQETENLEGVRNWKVSDSGGG
ncbi:MAG: response regulator [Enterocloster sp.]